MKIYSDMKRLTMYAIASNLITEDDFDYVVNRLSNLLLIDEYMDQSIGYVDVEEPSSLLAPILDYAHEIGLFTPNTVTFRDLFEAKIMDIFTPRPSEIEHVFSLLHTQDKQSATNYFYNLSQKNNYIKTARTSKNVIWKSKTPYGEFDMTINLSKPEKDPRDIIAQGKKSSTSYPQCLLCKENVGFYGNATHPGRSNHRIVKLLLNEEEFYLQYSPYVYYDEHSIVLKKEHVPMNVTKKTFIRLFDFIDYLPHYFLGSNAGLPIVGGSILSHEHYQGGRHHFAIEDAKVLSSYQVADVTVKQLFWPLSVIRLESTNRGSIIEMADQIYKFWEQYTDESAGIYAFTTAPHNAITPIARKNGDLYVLDITLRNNLTSEEFPLGIFHPHPENHHIKKENIGLIEVMGLAVLPARLASELPMIKDVIVGDLEIPQELDIHKEWIKELKQTYQQEDINQFLNDAVTLKFVKCIEDAGVFKQNVDGVNHFNQFMEALINVLN
ncbi:MAG: UDP-glucose--hexose-1-phosphate uridylyltransferase [Bacilli bacterium]|nr:UDP-glucose--hexose-1-phosphate uridylyltransferase [Bacilli bacterium]